MADIELVIKIPEEKYNYVIKQVAERIDNPLKLYIANGTPLPKGHGRIVDIGPYEGKVIASRKYCGVSKLVEVAELDTLIEADTDSEDKE